MIGDGALPWILDFFPLRHGVREKHRHEEGRTMEAGNGQ